MAGGAGSTAAARPAGSVKANDGSSPDQDDKGKGIGGTKRTSDSKASASDLKHNDANNAQDDDGANTPDSDRSSKRNNTSVSSKDKGSSGSKRSDPNQSDPDEGTDADNPADAGNANSSSSSGSTTKKPRGKTANKGDHAQDQGASEDDNASAEDADDEAAADGDDQEESPADDSASTVFDKKAPSLIADLDDLAAKGKKAKVKKETLRGARRTLEEPHKLFKDPARLAAARSGDPETVKHSLKHHGRAIVPVDDADPQDISADPDKLEAVRSNSNKAIRGVIDMGQQYGMDPFDGVDPADVQNIIEHHAAEHPHRKHKVPYVPPVTSDDDDVTSDDNDDNANADSADDGNGVSRSRVNKRKKTKQLDGGDFNSEDSSAAADASTNDEDGDNEEDKNAGSGENDKDEAPHYPKLDDAADLDPDDPDNDLSPRKKSNKKKRSYPKPYCNNDDPSDLQLACDSLSTMAADADDSDANDDDSDDAPLHKRKAHAAKKMLKCLNRVRSYQQDPAACEGAFVDEAFDKNAEVAGLSPDEIEEHYYALKEVSKKYKALSEPKDDDEEDNNSDDKNNDDNEADDDSDDSNYVPNDDNDDENEDDRPTHKKKKSHTKTRHGHHASHKHPEHNKHHKKTQHASSSHRHERYIDSEDSNPYNASFIRSQVDTDAQYEPPDIEMSLPENQFSGQTTRSNSGGAATYDSTLQGSDPSMAGLIQDPETGIYYYQDPTTGEYYIVDPITGEYSPVDSSQSEDEQADPSAGDSADPTPQITGLMSNPDEVTALASELSSTEKSAKSLEGAIGTISKTEKELVAVESAGSKAASASSKIKRLKGAKANYSKMINLCSNPMDNVTEAENALSMVNELAQNPDAVINQADALINVAQQGVSALASAKSPEDAMTVMMGMAAQMSGGGGDDDSEDDESEAEIDPNTGLAIDPTTGLEFDPTSGLAYDPVTGAMIDPNTGAPVDPYQVQSQQGNYTNALGVPAEFENEGMYGDE